MGDHFFSCTCTAEVHSPYLVLHLATCNLERNPGRASATTAALLVSVGVAATMVTGLTSVAASTDSYLSSGAPIDIRVQGTTAQQDIDSLTAQVKGVDGVQTVVAVPELSLRLTPENKDAYSDTRGDNDAIMAKDLKKRIKRIFIFFVILFLIFIMVFAFK